MSGITLFFFAVLGFLVSMLGVELVRRYSTRRNFFDVPNERSSHSRLTPRGGGLAIVAIVIVGLIGFEMLGMFSWAAVWGYLLGATLIAIVSWIDDRYSFPTKWRLLIHFTGAVLVIVSAGYFQSITLPFLGECNLGGFGFLLTLFWLVGLTNAYNFMDGIDGIAAGQAVVAGTGWMVIGILIHTPLAVILGMLIASSSLGFLIHNRPPARIFMGDVGSTFLGFTFAALPVLTIKNDSRLAFAGLLLLWPFIFDATFTFFRRLFRRENVFAAHRSHIYQRLVLAGHSHLVVSLIYVFLAIIGMVLSLTWSSSKSTSFSTFVVPIAFLGFMLWLFVVDQERRNLVNSKSKVHFPNTL